MESHKREKKMVAIKLFRHAFAKMNGSSTSHDPLMVSGLIQGPVQTGFLYSLWLTPLCSCVFIIGGSSSVNQGRQQSEKVATLDVAQNKVKSARNSSFGTPVNTTSFLFHLLTGVGIKVQNSSNKHTESCSFPEILQLLLK